MKVSRARKRLNMVKKLTNISVVGAVLVSIFVVMQTSNLSFNNVFFKDKRQHSINSKVTEVNTKATQVSESINIEQIDPQTSVKKVSFINHKGSITVKAKQANLQEVLESFAKEFGVRLRDYTSTVDELAVTKTFTLSGTLFELLDRVLQKYGYNNFVLNYETDILGNSGKLSDLATIYLFEDPIELAGIEDVHDLEADIEIEEVSIPAETRIVKRLEQQLLSFKNNRNEVGNSIAESKLPEQKSVVIDDPDFDITEGVPEHLQKELAAMTRQVTNDVKDLVAALRNNEAQLKANQFIDQSSQ